MNIIAKFKRDIIGIVWLAIGVFISLALISFNPADASFHSTGKSLKVLNYCGYFGSFLSDLLYQFMGLTAWVLVIACVRMSFRSFIGKEVNIRKLRYIWSALLIMTCSSLLSLYWPNLYLFEQQVPVGGLLGIAVSQGLVSIFNFYGVAVILWSISLILTIFYTEKPIKEIFFMPKDFCLDFLDKVHESGLVPGFKNLVQKFFSFLFAPFSKLLSRRPALAGGPKEIVDKGPALFKSQEEAPKLSGRSERFFKIKNEDVLSSSEKNAEEEFEEEIDESELEEEEWSEEVVEDELTDEPQFSLMGKLLNKKSPAKKRKVKLKAKVSRHIENWELPKLSLLEDPPAERVRVDEKEIRAKSQLLVDKLAQFNVGGKIVGVKPGPAVTLFEFKPNIDVKISKITELADDLSLALSSESVRIIAPIPGRDVVGIETSNSKQETVFLKDIIAEDEFWSEKVSLPVPLGRQANGEPKIVDLRKMPHLMVAGTTGSGKSVFIVSFVTSLLFKHSPKTLRLILVDPKQVDLALFDNIPHLMMPPIRDPKKAVVALRWAIREMEKRYTSMAKFGARNIESFNEKVIKLSKDEKQRHADNVADLEENHRNLESYYYEPVPYVVFVVEEFGDLMAVDKQNVEQGVVRLAQMARASGIHLVLAMQSPRKDVVTGLIKTNIPGRVSFKVASKLDSRVILDEGGAERLLARGDMLFLAPGVSKPARHHGAFLTEGEINGVVQFWAAQGEPLYDDLAMRALEGNGGGFDLGGGDDNDPLGCGDGDYDDRYDEILAWVSSQKAVSASLIQRKFRLGYPRAARIIEIMEKEGVVGEANGSKPRKVLINSYDDSE